MVKRVCRIVPAYAAAIFIYWLACFAIEPLPGDYESFMERLPYFLTFLPEYSSRNGYSIFTHAWTVGIEVKFYLFFPPVLFLLIKNPVGRFAVTAAALVVLTAVGSFIAQAYCALLFGAMLAFALEAPQGYALIAKATRVSPLVPLALVIATAAMLNYIEQFTIIAVVATYLTAYVIVQASQGIPHPDLAAAGVFGAAILWGVSAPLSGNTAGLSCLRQQHCHWGNSDGNLLPRRDRAGGRGDVSPDRITRD